MTERQPADAAARERVRSAIDETLFVEAGAGTGKTTALVTRICSLVEAGVPVGAIAAITFTEAAAAELRDRVRGELEKQLEQGGAAAERYEAALAELDSAAMQTLHGFARRILALYPLEAGLPPQFEVRDQVQMETAFGDAWSAFLAELFSGVDPILQLPRALTLGLTTKHLRSVAEKLRDNFDRLAPAHAATAAPVVIDVEPVLAALEAAIDMREWCHDSEDKLLIHLNKIAIVMGRLQGLSEAMAAAPDAISQVVAEQEFLNALNSTGSLKNTNGKKPNWKHGGHSYVEEVRSLVQKAEDARQALLEAVKRDCIEAVLPSLVNWTLDIAAARQAAGTLEYHDLLVLAVRLLRKDGRVRQVLHRRFTHLLIDEFQDTDPLQIELAALLATTATDVGDTPWHDLPVAPGSLFFVGDPRQSIYRFRRADIEVYEAAGQAFAPEAVHLTANFRSKRGIVAWANEVFAHLFETPYSGDSSAPRQTAYTPLVAHHQEDAPVVRVIGGAVDALRSGEVRAAEAAEVAALIRAARANNWLKKARPGEPATFADVTILIPDRTALPPLERALDAAEIPFRIEGSTLLFGTQEVRDFTNILAAIDDPADEVSVVAALRSPAFGCGDDELYRFRQLRPRRTWDYTVPFDDTIAMEDRVRQAMEALAGLYQEKAWRSNAEMVETVIRDRRLFEVAFANSRPRDTWQRLRFLHEHARRFDASGTGGLRHFVAWLREMAKSGAYLTESVVPEPDDDAVRIMTIHASKGLEFPIVFVAGLLTELRNLRSAVLFDRTQGTTALPEVCVGNSTQGYFRTAGYALLDVRERVMERLQRDRLLYVAATRARECLVVSAYYKMSKSGSHIQRHIEARCSLAECLDEACDLLPHLRGTAPATDSPLSMELPPPAAEPDLEVRDAWRRSRRELIAANSRPVTLAATAIAHAGEEPWDKPEPRDDDQSPWRRGRAGTAVGRAVHAVLQTIDHQTMEGLADSARAQAAAEGVPDRADEIAGLVRTACESRPLREALASGRSWRELYVATPVPSEDGDVLVEGFVDLLYRADDGYVVVDYKTDGVRTAIEIDRAMERYRLQGAAYALALGAQLDAPVTRFECVFVTPAVVRTVRGADLDGAIEEARARIGALRRGDAPVAV